MARNLTETLIIMGFRICVYDTCVALSADGNVVICFHVDDLMVVGRSASDCENFKSAFMKKFTIKSTSGDELDYLGIHIKVKAESIALAQLVIVSNGV